MTRPIRREPIARPACTGRNQVPEALAKATKRQREKAEQERLCRAGDLHQYLTLKGRV